MESNNNRNYMRNLILTCLMAIGYTFAIAQTQPALPAGTTPYSSSIFKATDGDLWTGKAGGYTNIGNKAWVTAQLATKQNALVSGTNIKAINGTTIMGSGNLVIDLPIVVKNPYTLIDVGGLATRDTLMNCRPGRPNNFITKT